MDTMRALGLMSGTSLDGVDVALIETDGERVQAFGPTSYRPYRDDERALLRQALADAETIADRTARPGQLAAAEAMVTRAHVEAVETFLSTNGIDRSAIDVVGFHGQTVFHLPPKRLTVQIGDAGALARSLDLPVVYDLRVADVAAGGQGAPLVPLYHQALVRGLKRPAPVVVVNLGGVANITYVGGDTVIACDTGPANAPIDDFMRERTGAGVDKDGAAAAAGRVDETALARLLRHPFFAEKPPKSLDRNDFRSWIAAEAGLAGKSAEDGAATLTALVAATVARVVPMLPEVPKSWIIAGGGASNPTLMGMLRARLAPATVEPATAVGWSADALEAQAFAFLAVRSLRGLPITLPTTTGAPQPMTGGLLVRPQAA